MSTQVLVSTVPPCDLCSLDTSTPPPLAFADARIPSVGSWAYVCKPCFDRHGCTLGTGHGQALVTRENGVTVYPAGRTS
jgi:hypothetical protein